MLFCPRASTSKILRAAQAASLCSVLAIGACSKDDDSSSSSGGSDPGTVVSGSQPDGQKSRYAKPEDTTPPAELSAFSVAMGKRLGEILIVLGYPDQVDDYARIVLRRAAGSVEPADCDAGTEVAEVTDFSKSTYVDAGHFPGSFHSYIACLYDEADNLVKIKSLSTGRANDRQRLFVTSATYDGNLKASFKGDDFDSGREGADARCQFHADAASLGGKWRAILGSAGTTARRSVPIYGGIYNTKGERLATSAATFWDGDLDRAPDYDENGSAAAATVWAGAYSNGNSAPLYNCSDWTSTTSYAWTGLSETLPSATYPGDWLSAQSTLCSELAALYCVESVATSFDAAEVTVVEGATLGDVEVEVAFGATTNVGAVELYREAGSNLLNLDCLYRYGNRIEDVKSYTGSEDRPFSDDAFTDNVDTDDDGATDEQGFYQYYTCTYDTYGNVTAQTEAAAVTVGTDYRRAFLTDDPVASTGATVAAANTACTTAATAAGLTGTFKAFLSDSSTNARANVGQTDTLLIFDTSGNYSGYSAPGSFYTSGRVAAYADGSAAALGTSFWTGSDPQGNYYSGYACNDWVSTSSGDYGMGGAVYDGSAPWGSYTYLPCSGSHRIACIEAN
jgi:hypothetical protein